VPYTLLLADDSVTIQRVIELTFADEDVQVVAVGDGDQAIERLESCPPDIVLADVGMPGRNGYEVSRYVKQTPKLAHIPVVLLTGAFEPVDAQKAAEVGCDGVLAKPFEPQLVIGRVKELLAGPARRLSPSPDANPSAPMPAAAPLAPPAPNLVPRSAAEAGPARGDLDNYFDRLDVAFSHLSASPAQESGTARSVPDIAAAAAEDGVDDVHRAHAAGAAAADAADGVHGAHAADGADIADVAMPPVSDPTDWLTAPKSATLAGDLPLTYSPLPAIDEPDEYPFALRRAPTTIEEEPVVTERLPEPVPAPSPAVVAAEKSFGAPRPELFAPAAAPSMPAAAADPTVARALAASVLVPLPTMAEAFAVFLAAEQGGARPGAPPDWPTIAPTSVEITEDVIEQVSRRVLDRLSERVVRETVVDLVTTLAERLVREEIEHIKATIK
jgi:CheY-like chemotaxis protein